jgi:hypothetical protein
MDAERIHTHSVCLYKYRERVEKRVVERVEEERD